MWSFLKNVTYKATDDVWYWYYVAIALIVVSIVFIVVSIVLSGLLLYPKYCPARRKDRPDSTQAEKTSV